uniref:Uncharacterized protein n=1 Tax=Panagrolaimus sp. ES5 TaxID=591445 RepID=A0AC34FYC7_9BILA
MATEQTKSFVDTTKNDEFNNIDLNNHYNSCFTNNNTLSETAKKDSVKDCGKSKPFKRIAAISNVLDLGHTNILFAKKDSWKSNKQIPTTFLNLKRDSEENNKSERPKDPNSSTLSLHIATYENSIQADVTDDAKRGAQSRKNLMMVKQFDDYLQNPFEFPRQQDDRTSKPEVMQFQASQKLLNPSQSGNKEGNIIGHTHLPNQY